jgi:small redox-active disulfide protein 2
MKRVQILGIGCPTCEKLRNNAEAAVAELGIEATVELITDVNAIVSFDVLMTPALVIDGDVKAVGKVPTTNDIKKLLA